MRILKVKTNETHERKRGGHTHPSLDEPVVQAVTVHFFSRDIERG